MMQWLRSFSQVVNDISWMLESYSSGTPLAATQVVARGRTTGVYATQISPKNLEQSRPSAVRGVTCWISGQLIGRRVHTQVLLTTNCGEKDPLKQEVSNID